MSYFMLKTKERGEGVCEKMKGGDASRTDILEGVEETDIRGGRKGLDLESDHV